MLMKKLSLFVFVFLLGHVMSAQEGWHRLYEYEELDSDTIQLIDAATTPEGLVTLTNIVKDTQSIVALVLLDKKGDTKWTKFITNQDKFLKDGSVEFNPRKQMIQAFLTFREEATSYEVSILESGLVQSTLADEAIIGNKESSKSVKIAYQLVENGSLLTFNVATENPIRKELEIALKELFITVNHNLDVGIISGSNDQSSSFIEVDTLGNIRKSVKYSADSPLINPVASPVTDSTSIYAAEKSDSVYVWMVDSIGAPIWTKRYSIKGHPTSVDDLEFNGKNYVFTGQYIESDTVRRYATALSLEGKVVYTSIFKNDVSLDANVIHTERNMLNAGILMLGTGLNTSGDTVTAIINMDKDGLAMCSDFIEIDTLENAVVTRDTVEIQVKDLDVNRTEAELRIENGMLYSVPKLSIAPEKTQFCIGEEVNELLDASISGVPDSLQTYKWSTGETTDTIRGTETDKIYKVDVTVNYETCYMQCDSVVLTRYAAPQGDIQPTFTSGCTADLRAAATGGKAPYTYLWDNGSTEQVISVTEEKTYSVTFTDACGQIGQASVGIVYPTLQASITPTVVKPCEEVRLQVVLANQEAPVTYLWSTGATTESITVTADGTYSVMIKDACDKEVSASYELTLNKPITGFDVNHLVTCADDNNAQSTVVFSISTQGGNFQGIRLINKRDSTEYTSIAQPLPLSNYRVEVTDFCGNTLTKDLNISGECGGCLRYPKVFFPNGMEDDERSFGAVDLCGGTEGISNYDFRIYNRWGQEVFATDKIEEKWNGKIGTSDAPSEVYVYYARYTLEEQEVTAKGDVTIIR